MEPAPLETDSTIGKSTPPRAAREIASALKAEVHAVAAGHFMMQEQPEQVLAAVRKALA